MIFIRAFLALLNIIGFVVAASCAVVAPVGFAILFGVFACIHLFLLIDICLPEEDW